MADEEQDSYYVTKAKEEFDTNIIRSRSIGEDALITILIVEDDDQAANNMKNVLEGYGYQVIGIEGEGGKALQRIEQENPSIVLLNIELKGDVDGVELSKRIERLNVPVIFLVEDINDPVVTEALLTAPYGYLFKPFSDLELKRAIEVVFKKHILNVQSILEAENKIKEKNVELIIEKVFASAIFILSFFLVVVGFISLNITWLQWLLFILSILIFFTLFVGMKKQDPAIPYDVNPFVSIIIPAHNEEASIARTLRSVGGLDYYLDGKPNFEILVVDDGSTDDTGAILKSLKKEIPMLRIITRVPPRSGKGKGFVLNDALALSKGDIVGVFDADTRVKPDFLNIIIPYLNSPDVVAVQSRVKMANKNDNFLTKAQHLEFAVLCNNLRAKDNLNYSSFLGGNGQFTKKQAILDAGKWDGFAYTEDFNISVKIMINGGGIRNCGEAAIYQEAVKDWKSLFKQRIRWSVGNFEVLFIYLSKILYAPVSFSKKASMIEFSTIFAFNMFIFFGFVAFFGNIIGYIVLGTTLFTMNAPIGIGLISILAFFPNTIYGLYRDKMGVKDIIIGTMHYWVYCFYQMPLFFITLLKMITRKERTWDKTVHVGAGANEELE